MKQSDTTHLFAIPWASQADSSTISTIPATTAETGRASMALGFPKATMTPRAAGGVPPYGEDMNGILAMLSIAARASEAGLLRPFSANFANAIGGYPSGATVAHPSVQGRFLICVLDGNTNDPGNSMEGWVDPLQFTVQSHTSEGNLQVQSIGVQQSTNQIWMRTNDGTFYHAPTDGQYATPADLVGVVRSNADSNDLQIQFIGAQANTGALWFGAGDGKFFHPAMAGDLQAEQMRAQSAEAALQPAGNYVKAVGAGGRKTLGFTAAVTHGQRIDFPEPFNSDDVQISLTPQDGGNNRFHIANWFTKDAQGFSISLNGWTGSTFSTETNPTLVMVRAYGYGG